MRRIIVLLLLAATFVALPAFAIEVRDTAAPAPAAGEPAQAERGEHVPTFDDINWFYGWVGERDNVEPGLLFRPTGMPAPFGVWILNAVALYVFIAVKAKKPLAEALKGRKANILRGIEDAARMKRDAEKRLAQYDERLANIEEEVERVRKQMREAAEAERARILADAHARRERMEKDAQLLVAQEFAAARDALKAEMVNAALTSAAQAVKARLHAEDHERLADEYLAGITRAGDAMRGRA